MPAQREFRCSGEEAYYTALMHSRLVPATWDRPAYLRRWTAEEAVLWLADAPRDSEAAYDPRSDSWTVIDPKDAEEFGR